MAPRQQLITHMLTALETPKTPLTPWEENFLESISDQFTQRGTLSDKQFDILDRIYTEKSD